MKPLWHILAVIIFAAAVFLILLFGYQTYQTIKDIPKEKPIEKLIVPKVEYPEYEGKG